MTLEILTPEQGFEIFQKDMFRDFPEDEIKPWEVILRMVNDGVYDLLAAIEDGTMVGYAWIFRPDSDAVLIDYLAVMPQLRGTGVGTRILSALGKQYCAGGKRLLLESEYPETAPEPDVARRRLGFYAKAGFCDTGVQVLLFGVRFCILSLGEDKQGRDHMDQIYRAMFPGERYHQAVQFL